MKTIGFISCTKRKQSYPCKASEMYSASDLFKKAYAYAVENYDFVAILSAKYGLLLPNDKVEPYNLTLNGMSTDEVREWSERTAKQMNNRLQLRDFSRAFFHAGERYRRYLIPRMEGLGIRCEIPLKGLGIGKQKAWYKERDHAEGLSISSDESEACGGKEMPTSADFEATLQEIFDHAEKEGMEYVDVVSGRLHGQLGRYPGSGHRMPDCCYVMKRMMRHGDEILHQPPKGQGATLIIRYHLPRK